MISRHISQHAAGRHGLFLFLACLAALALPAPAGAEEFMPFDIPDEASPFDSPGFDTSLPEFTEPEPAVPAVPQATTETAPPPAAPADTGPPLMAPKIDAYVDVSFNDSDLSAIGYAATPSGYRFVVGFIFQELGNERWTIAPEAGYFRIDTAEQDNVTVDRNSPSLPQYIVTTTHRLSSEIASLDFGGRFGFKINDRTLMYARTGLGFYHRADTQETTRAYEPKNLGTAPRDSDILPPDSFSNAGVAPYGTLGIAIMLGQVPSVYVEYGSRRIEGELLNTTSLGLLLNF